MKWSQQDVASSWIWSWFVTGLYFDIDVNVYRRQSKGFDSAVKALLFNRPVPSAVPATWPMGHVGLGLHATCLS